jgi:hypothetical protein
VASWRNFVWHLPGGTAMRPYQGQVALVLAACALVPVGAAWGRAARPQAAVVVGLAVAGALGYLLALGPEGGAFYSFLRQWVPGFSATRAPARFTVLVAFTVAALAGIGWGALARRLGRAAWPVTAAVVAAVAFDVGLLGKRVPLTAAPDTAPPAARWLAEHGDGGPVLELPVRRFPGDPRGAQVEQLYALRSLVHLHPELNGRSGYVPPSYELLMPFARRLPDARALDGLVSLAGLRWVVTHGRQTEAWAQLPPRLELAATLGDDRVYRVVPGDGPRWEDELVARLRGKPETETFAGTPLDPLTPRALDNEVMAFGAPSTVKAGATAMVTIVTRNVGPRTWPALALDERRIVVLRLTWRDERGERAGTFPPVRGLADTPPGGVAAFHAMVPAPLIPGPYRLSARLAQGDLERRIGGQTRVRVMVEP